MIYIEIILSVLATAAAIYCLYRYFYSDNIRGHCQKIHQILLDAKKRHSARIRGFGQCGYGWAAKGFGSESNRLSGAANSRKNGRTKRIGGKLDSISMAVIGFLLGVIGFIIKLDVEHTKKSMVKKEQMETVRVSLDSILASASTLAKAVDILRSDIEINYVRKETVSGRFDLIQHEQAAFRREFMLELKSINEKIGHLSETRRYMEEVRKLKS